MNSGLITGLIAGPNRLSKAVLSRKQTIPGAEITQALANLGIARVSLSAPVTRTSTTTLSNTGLSALTVNLLPSSRYRLTYRIYDNDGGGGMQFALTFPTSLPAFDAESLTWDQTNYATSVMVPDWPTNSGPSGAVIYDSSFSPSQASVRFTADITTGSTANTYGDVTVLLAQSQSNAAASVFTQNSCVEVLKFS
jgi:hypothetical protein